MNDAVEASQCKPKENSEQVESEMLDPYALLRTLIWLEDNHLIQSHTVKYSTAYRNLEMIERGETPPEVIV